MLSPYQFSNESCKKSIHLESSLLRQPPRAHNSLSCQSTKNPQKQIHELSTGFILQTMPVVWGASPAWSVARHEHGSGGGGADIVLLLRVLQPRELDLATAGTGAISVSEMAGGAPHFKRQIRLLRHFNDFFVEGCRQQLKIQSKQNYTNSCVP